jgi:hypothetical protein
MKVKTEKNETKVSFLHFLLTNLFVLRLAVQACDLIECIRLRNKDIDFDILTVTIRGDKGEDNF